MSDEISDHTRRYFFERSKAWKDLIDDTCTTYPDAGHRVRDGTLEQKENIFDTSLGYLSEISHEISVYEDAIRRLQLGTDAQTVKDWLNGIGYSIHLQSTFWQTLGKKIAQLSQTAMQVIRNFVASCATALGMPMSGVDIKFGMPHSLTVKFAP